jgi:hypothetical protein
MEGRLFKTSEIIQNNVQLCIRAREDYKIYRGRNGIYCCNVKTVTITESYRVSLGITFIPDGQISQPPTGAVG